MRVDTHPRGGSDPVNGVTSVPARLPVGRVVCSPARLFVENWPRARVAPITNE
jgi:hypothetical protein